MSEQRWLLCGYENVVAQPPNPYDMSAMAKAANMSRTELRDALRSIESAPSLHEKWKLAIDEGLVASVVELETTARTRPLPETLQALGLAKERGFCVGLLIDQPREVVDAVEGSDWSDAFERIYATVRLGESGLADALDKVVAELGVPAEHVTYLDSAEARVLSARGCGLRGVVFTEPTRLDQLVPLV